MVVDENKFRIISGIFDLAGQFISNQFVTPDYEERANITNTFYKSAKDLVRKEEKDVAKVEGVEETPEPDEDDLVLVDFDDMRDMTDEKIEGGTSCLQCGKSHFSTVAGALNEAMRFARNDGVNHPEVRKRLGIAEDELNMLERIDLAPENIVKLDGGEKQIAEWGLNKSRDLRHKLTAIQSPDDLERVAADASNVRTKFMSDLWELVATDGNIERICEGLSGEEREECVSTINVVLNEKKKSI